MNEKPTDVRLDRRVFPLASLPVRRHAAHPCGV